MMEMIYVDEPELILIEETGKEKDAEGSFKERQSLLGFPT